MGILSALLAIGISSHLGDLKRLAKLEDGAPSVVGLLVVSLGINGGTGGFLFSATELEPLSAHTRISTFSSGFCTMDPLPYSLLCWTIYRLQQGSSQTFSYLLFKAVGIPVLQQGFHLVSSVGGHRGCNRVKWNSIKYRTLHHLPSCGASVPTNILESALFRAAGVSFSNPKERNKDCDFDVAEHLRGPWLPERQFSSRRGICFFPIGTSYPFPRFPSSREVRKPAPNSEPSYVAKELRSGAAVAFESGIRLQKGSRRLKNGL